MIKKTLDLNDFFIATLLGDLFDPSGSDDIEFVAKKIVNGLEKHRIIDCKDIKDEDIEDEELIAS